jgi:hypothetical protein
MAYILALIVGVGSIPISASLRFDWYYAGKEVLLGNLTSCMEADEGELWVAMFDAETAGGQRMYVFSAELEEWREASYNGKQMTIDRFRFITMTDSKVLTGGAGGALVLDRGSGESKGYTQADGLPSDDLFSATVRSNEIWFGTSNGIGRLDQAGRWQYYTKKDGLPDNKVLHMLFDGPVLWACTENGVGRLDTDSDTWEMYTQKDGLPGQAATRALADQDYVWFAMEKGAARLDKTTHEIRAYAAADGLLSEEVKDIEILGEKIYLATSRGVSYKNRFRNGNWRSIAANQGLPAPPGADPGGSASGSNVTHLAVQGEHLWIALWNQGIVRMSIPTGLATVPYWVWVALMPFTTIIIASSIVKLREREKPDR